MPETRPPLDNEKIASIMIDTTLLIERVTALQSHIEPNEFFQTLKKLSEIGDRVGVLYVASDRAYLDKVKDNLNPAIHDEFLSAAEEYLFQVDRFTNMIEGIENVTV